MTEHPHAAQSRVWRLRRRIEADPSVVASCLDELLELAETDQWLTARTAVEALADGIQHHPETGREELANVVTALLDPGVLGAGRLGPALQTVVETDPQACYGPLEASLQRVGLVEGALDEVGLRSLFEAVLRVAMIDPSLVSGSLKHYRRAVAVLPPEGRTELLWIHLAVVDTDPAAVRPAVPHLLREFERGSERTRDIAGEVLCALARTPEGTAVVESMYRWLGTHPVRPREIRRTIGPREPVNRPDLTGGLDPSVVGVATVLARLAEESPEHVRPHAHEIASTLANSDTEGYRHARDSLTRAVSAVARQRPDDCRELVDPLWSLLDDSSGGVRYWAAQGLQALACGWSVTLDADRLLDRLDDDNPDVQRLCLEIMLAGVDRGTLDAEQIASSLGTTIADGDEIRTRRAVEWLASLAEVTPTAVEPALPAVESALLGEDITTAQASAVFEPVARTTPSAAQEAVDSFVERLLDGDLTGRRAAAGFLETLAEADPSTLDPVFERVESAIGQEGFPAAEVGTVLAAGQTQPFDSEQTVREWVCARTVSEEPVRRRHATLLAGHLLAGAAETPDSVVSTLQRRLSDDDRTRAAAIDALGEFVSDRPAAGSDLLRTVFEAADDRVKRAGAEILDTSVLFDATWPDAAFQRWLAERVESEETPARETLIEAAGRIARNPSSTDRLTAALTTCLDDPTVRDAVFDAVDGVLAERPAAVDSETLAGAIEIAVEDAPRRVPSACLRSIPRAAGAFEEPQALAEALLETFDADERRTARTLDALNAVCARHDEVSVSTDPFVAHLQKRVTTEWVLDREYCVREIARFVRQHDSGDTLRETLLELTNAVDTETAGSALRALAAVASVWPECVRPVTDTLVEQFRDGDRQIRRSAFAALVFVGRASPDVLSPVAEDVQTPSSEGSQGDITATRRRYEAIALLAGDGDCLDPVAFETLLDGLRHDDSAVTEYSLRAVAASGDSRALPVLRRMRTGVPDWTDSPLDPTGETEVRASGFDGLLDTSHEPSITVEKALEALS